MGSIINPRGASGAGKTELVRRIMHCYGAPQPLHRRGRASPILYRFAHPHGGRPLAVLGHYERTSGGCDTITRRDGGMAEAFRLATLYAAAGDDVLFEGSILSEEHIYSVRLAEAHPLYVLRLTTPVEICVGNLIGRRRAARSARPRIADAASLQDGRIDKACARLRGRAAVERVGFEDALRRARALLGLPAPEA